MKSQAVDQEPLFEAVINWAWANAHFFVVPLVILLLGGVHLACKKHVPIYTAVVYGLGSTIYKLWCWLWVFWWGLNHAVRRALLSTVLGIAFVACVPAALDATLVVFHAPVVEALHDLPMWVRASAAVVFVFLAYMRISEWRDHRRRRIFLGIIRTMALETAALRLSDDETSARSEVSAFMTKVLLAFRPLFAANMDDPTPVSMNVMLPDHTGQSVAVAVMYPNGTMGEPARAYDENATFRRAEGVAGCVWEQRRMLYVPNIKMQHAIAIELLDGEHPRGVELKPDLYKPLPRQPFSSMISAPVRLPHVDEKGVVTAGEAAAVLNIDSTARNAFGESSWEFASIAASFLAEGLVRYRLKFPPTRPIS